MADCFVLLADDHDLFRRGLSLALQDRVPDIRILEAGTLDEALELVQSHPELALLLIDLRMPGMQGDSSLRAIRQAYPSLKVAVVSGSSDREDVLACLAAGVHGYIVKSLSAEQLIEACTDVLKGQIYVPAELAQLTPASGGMAKAAERPASEERAPGLARLTPRQQDVFRLLAQGKATKEIARALDLGEGTVKVHLSAIYRVLKARNRTEAAVLAAKYKL